MPYPEWYALMSLSDTALVPSYYVKSIVAADGQPAPPEIRERFEGRRFRLHELEQRGVRIAGGHVWYMAQSRDWRLTLAPAT